MRASVRPCLLALLALLPGSAATAETADVLQRLRQEPLTLFDWGMAQLERDIDRVAYQLWQAQDDGDAFETGTIYDWRARRVTLFATQPSPASARTPAACRERFRAIVARLIEGAPQGADAAGWYLLHAFQPTGHYWASRFEDVGAKLLDAVRLRVSLTPQETERMVADRTWVRCHGRLDATGDAIVTETRR